MLKIATVVPLVSINRPVEIGFAFHRASIPQGGPQYHLPACPGNFTGSHPGEMSLALHYRKFHRAQRGRQMSADKPKIVCGVTGDTGSVPVKWFAKFTGHRKQDLPFASTPRGHLSSR